MIVVADTGPVQYLVRIGVIHVLAPLYKSVLVPQSVARELQQNTAAAEVCAWIARPPTWCEVHPDPPADPALAFLDPGERAAISLALAVRAHRLLIDDLAGRAEAERRHLVVTGTVGVLADAHLTGLLDFGAGAFSASPKQLLLDRSSSRAGPAANRSRREQRIMDAFRGFVKQPANRIVTGCRV